MIQGPWSDGVPNGWQLRPLWSEFRRGKTSGDGSEELLSVYRDYGVIPKSSRDDNFNKPSEDLSKYQRVAVGDLVVNKMKAWQGSLGISNHDGIVSPAYFVYKATGSFERRFAHYLLRSKQYADHMAAISAGVRPNQWDLDPTQFAVTPLLVPPPAEQRAIADYLDRETAQIDAFIAKNEELITLLTERRASTITSALTSGLEGRPREQDDQWFGVIPAQWESMPLRYLLRRIEQGVSPQAEGGLAEGEDQFGVLKSGCVNGGVYRPTEHKLLPAGFAFDPSLLVCSGDLLVNRASGSIPLLGSAALVRESPYQLILSDKIFRLVPSARTTSRFLYWLLNSRLYREQVESSVSGADGLANNLPQSSLRRFVLPVPPRKEQGLIDSHLTERCAQIDKSIDTARRGVELARERRAALISAAVTGKIDVEAPA